MCLEGSYHPLMFHPACAEIADLPLDDRRGCAAVGTHPGADQGPDDGGSFERIVLGRQPIHAHPHHCTVVES